MLFYKEAAMEIFRIDPSASEKRYVPGAVPALFRKPVYYKPVYTGFLTFFQSSVCILDPYTQVSILV